MAYRDHSGRAQAAIAQAEQRRRARCQVHAIAWANGLCDACHGDFCGACLGKPIEGGTFCSSCLERYRGSWLRTRWVTLLVAVVIAVAVVVIGGYVFVIARHAQ